MSFIFHFWKTLFCSAWMPMYISSSKAATNSTTNNIDQRLVTEEGATAVSASGGSQVQINTLDGGAIKASFGLGEYALDRAMDFATASQSGSARTAELAMRGAFDTLDESRESFEAAAMMVANGYKTANDKIAGAYGAATDKIESAYETSKIGDRNAMNIGALLVGGAAVLVVGVMALKGK